MESADVEVVNHCPNQNLYRNERTHKAFEVKGVKAQLFLFHGTTPSSPVYVCEQCGSLFLEYRNGQD